MIDLYLLSLNFRAPSTTEVVLDGNWNAVLVLISILIAIYASCIAFQVAGQARAVHHTVRREIMLLAGSLALGGGVWSMHFVGMLAFHLPMPLEYGMGTTLFSMTPSVAASWIALRLIVKEHISTAQLLTGGVLVGSGIGLMHYTGMAAMNMDHLLRYDPVMFGGSIVVAVTLAILALWIRFGVNRWLVQQLSALQLNLISGLVMGLAISGMHYMGMAAARFVVNANEIPVPQPDSVPLTLAIGVAVMTVAITSLVLTINLAFKYREVSRRARKNENRLRATLATAADAVLAVNTKGQIVEANDATLRILGWDPEALTGCTFAELVPDFYFKNGRIYRVCDTCPDNENLVGTDCEAEATCYTGRKIPVRLAFGFAALDSESLYVVFISDISQRLAMENDLRNAKELAEQSANARETFLASMSHEIRTPMNAIIGFSKLLLSEGALTSSQSHHLTTINTSATSLLHLLNDILDIAKLEKGKVELLNVDFSLRDEAEQVVSTFQLQAREKGLQLEYHYNQRLHEHYVGAPDKIRQVLTNLIGNAVKFTDSGRVRVDINPTADGDDILITITDTGIGIAEEQLQSIFDPFKQADATVSRRFGGTGLGTAISKELVELMGGSISVSSKLGAGSCFSIRLQLPAGQMRERVESSAGADLPPLKILVADDLPFNLELLQLMLTQLGHEVVVAEDGRRAVALAHSTAPDVILMDMRMPVMNGLEATRAIRQYEADNNLPSVPVVALTASVFEQDRQDAREAGMNGFVTKPVESGVLQVELARVLNLEEHNARPARAEIAAPVVAANAESRHPALDCS